MLVKRALLIGIDEYDSFRNLGGCVNDVVALFPLLSRNEDGGLNFSCHKITTADNRIEREDIMVGLDRLLAPGADIALLYFAGHGVNIGNDVALVAQNGTQREPGVTLSYILSRTQESSVKELLIILDCCFSGAAGNVPQLGNNSAFLQPGVSILTASRGDEGAEETIEGRGAFSTYLCGALEGGAADVLGKVNVSGVFAYLSESFDAWEQNPTFKSNVSRLHELRCCAPAVSLKSLRLLSVLFTEADTELSLDPSYEPDSEPANPQNEAAFAILQQCRAAKLVEPVGVEHMYFAAMQSKSCRLTPLGKHYWRLSKNERI